MTPTSTHQKIDPKLDWLAINTLRTLSIDAIQKANSGHPGLPLGAAPFSFVLFQRHLKFNPKNPQFFDRDRFVLSAGHGSALLYSLLHLYGYDLSLDDLKNFRQLGSKTPGHPEYGVVPGVEATTGPLGQGSANAVGMAIAERKLAQLLNTDAYTLVDHHTYCLVGDGDLMEGISAEAASLAGHLKLGKLIYLYDSNDISLDGPTSLTFTEDVSKRYESYGWQVLTVQNADYDLEAIDQAITQAKQEVHKPSLIIFKTTIGFGSPNKAGKSSSHGSPLGVDEVLLTKKALNWEYQEPFTIPNEVKNYVLAPGLLGESTEQKWSQALKGYKNASPEKYNIYQQNLFDLDLIIQPFQTGEDFATRESAGKVLNTIAKNTPYFFGGDADLSCSTNTLIKDGGTFEGEKGTGRNIHYGVREHAMGAIANGIAYHGGLRTYTATFFAFLDYMKPAVRLAAMNHLPVTFIFTHDSVGLGEDGPTHQPVEQMMSLRGIPNLISFRPADANEARAAWIYSMKNKNTPTALVLSRQKLKTLPRDQTLNSQQIAMGAYVLSDRSNSKITLIATGSEVHTALEVQNILEQKGVLIRVVSMPSMELFLKQPKSYQEQVLQKYHRFVSLEAGITHGWAEIIGKDGLAIGVNQYGLSAPASKIYEKLGLNSQQIASRIIEWNGTRSA